MKYRHIQPDPQTLAEARAQIRLYIWRIAPYEKVWIVEHCFFQQYRFWGSFVLPEADSRLLRQRLKILPQNNHS